MAPEQPEECLFADLIESVAVEMARNDDTDANIKYLVDKGIPNKIAQRIVLFTQSAFAREYYEPKGIQFPDFFYFTHKGKFQKRLYKFEPLYLHARDIARRWFSESKLEMAIKVLAGSAEAAAIEQIQAKGKTPKKIDAVHHGFTE
jgi:hypothetical protein